MIDGALEAATLTLTPPYADDLLAPRPGAPDTAFD
jgi:hypothetical protein